jgi:flagellar biosynthetic protein FlhB
MSAPRVAAKGADELAQRIKRIAAENDIPIVENKPLARALYAEAEVGDTIPLAYYEAVAIVLAPILKMNEERRQNEGLGA